VLTFEPHPKHLFRPDEPPARITPPAVKQGRLAACGAEIIYSIDFNWDLASMTAEHFIRNVLHDGLGAVHVVVGHDFRFGQLRQGGPDDIRAAGIGVTIVDEISGDDGLVFSSSRVRQHLRDGDIALANDILGWPWEIRGEVMRGDRRGHDLGYPTANFKLGQTIHPAYGVYAARVNVAGESEWYGAAINIGIRPMFEIPEAQVESFIFDFNREIYGQILRVQPVQRLRSEAKFNSLDELKNQMAKDCDQARVILKSK
jgi:riboflavin kinase/FMN adenylyltransferase